MLNRFWRRSRYARVKSSEELWLVIDAGNTDAKGMIHGHFGEEIVIPHAVLLVDESQYGPLARSYEQSKMEGTVIFKSNGTGYLVGQDAIADGRRLQGVTKYTRDQLGVLFESIALSLHPETHLDVHVLVLHPPKISDEDLEAIRASLRGKHTLEVPGIKDPIVYRVREIVDIDEPVATFNTFLFTEEGKTFAEPGLDFNPGSAFIILDVGGGISALVEGRIQHNGRIHLNHQSAEPIEVGINDVVKAADVILRDAFRDKLGMRNRLPDDMIVHALMTGEIVIKNHGYPCAEQVAKAMRVLSEPIKQVYKNSFHEGVNASGIVVSGGGGGIAYNFLSAQVLSHDFIRAAEIVSENMRVGGVRGASKGLIAFLSDRARQTAQKGA